MLIQMLPTQIPWIWEQIKFTAVTTDMIAEEDYEVYCLNLLQDLLSGNKGCLASFKDEQVSFLLLFGISVEPNTGNKYLSINNIFAFDHHNNEQWKEVYQDVIKLAKKTKCSYLGCNTTNPRAVELLEFLGFKLFTHKYYRRV